MRWIWHTALAGTLLLGTTAGCGRVLSGAITAAPALLPISDAQEIAVGRQAAQEVVQQVPVVQDAQLQAYVQQLGQSLVARSDRQDIPYTFTVIEMAEPNAFALPGGFIFVSTGILRIMENEAQLAGVLGHEIAHVAERHSIDLIRAQAIAQGVQVAALGTDPGTSQVVANIVRELVTRGYGRAKEIEADRLGTAYVGGLDYVPAALAAFLQRLNAATGTAVPTWLSTHPSVEQRLQAIQETIAQLGLDGQALNRERFLEATASIR